MKFLAVRRTCVDKASRAGIDVSLRPISAIFRSFDLVEIAKTNEWLEDYEFDGVFSTDTQVESDLDLDWRPEGEPINSVMERVDRTLAQFRWLSQSEVTLNRLLCHPRVLVPNKRGTTDTLHDRFLASLVHYSFKIGLPALPERTGESEKFESQMVEILEEFVDTHPLLFPWLIPRSITCLVTSQPKGSDLDNIFIRLRKVFDQYLVNPATGKTAAERSRASGEINDYTFISAPNLPVLESDNVGIAVFLHEGRYRPFWEEPFAVLNELVRN